MSSEQDLVPAFRQRRGEKRLHASMLVSCLSILALFCLAAAARGQAPESAPQSPASQRPESELIFEGEGCFGHYHIFAYSWWSNLYTGGIEYDRHSWGYIEKLHARKDYVAEVLPIVILKQPSKTDVYGDPLTRDRKLTPGVAISPVGLRLMWRDGKRWKPYFIAKGGVIAFTQKSLSQYGSYQDFLLQLGLGMQFKVNDKFDFRVGYSDIHFSNAFMVPNNAGLDVMTYNGGLAYHFGK